MSEIESLEDVETSKWYEPVDPHSGILSFTFIFEFYIHNLSYN